MDSDSGQFILKQGGKSGRTRTAQKKPTPVRVSDGKPKGPEPTAPHVRRGRQVATDGFTVPARRAGHRDVPASS